MIQLSPKLEVIPERYASAVTSFTTPLRLNKRNFKAVIPPGGELHIVDMTNESRRPMSSDGVTDDTWGSGVVGESSRPPPSSDGVKQRSRDKAGDFGAE